MKKKLKIIKPLLTNLYIDLDIYNTNGKTNNTVLDLANKENLIKIINLLKNYKPKNTKSNEWNYTNDIINEFYGNSFVTFRTIKYLNNLIEKFLRIIGQSIEKDYSQKVVDCNDIKNVLSQFFNVTRYISEKKDDYEENSNEDNNNEDNNNEENDYYDNYYYENDYYEENDNKSCETSFYIKTYFNMNFGSLEIDDDAYIYLDSTIKKILHDILNRSFAKKIIGSHFEQNQINFHYVLKSIRDIEDIKSLFEMIDKDVIKYEVNMSKPSDL
ncbi:hypothetical protein M9Y10_024601 [Tritrichomonas musculus]|uniref:Uncharacterized protein n=1 Tax=Tritrichomonas musculus TaxID=1915356 RepID=A0ABR2HAQ6_9EUKA